MLEKKIYLASDNWSPAHPLVMQAVSEANKAYAPSYGMDQWTQVAQQIIQENFKKPCKIFIIPTGTGANIFGLKLACRTYESIICTDISHIQYQESGAAEAVIGCKLLTVPHNQGKATPAAILKKIKTERAFGKHSTSPRVLSIAQPTEVGTIYTLEELKSLSELCQSENLLFHIDGSRLYNAAVSLQISLHEMIAYIQLDLLSLGGTKNGLMNAEALLIFNPKLEAGSDYLQKQTLQLVSKMRYLSAQFIPFFTNQLWYTLALQANQKAQEIAAIIKTIPHLKLSHEVQTNQIFFTAPFTWIPLIQEKIFCYVWDQFKNEIRLITSWNTSEDDINNLRLCLNEIAFQTNQKGDS